MELNNIPSQGSWSNIANDLNENFQKVRLSVEGLIGISGTNFLGIFPNISSAGSPSTAAWCLVGTDLSQLKLYTWDKTTWKAWDDKTYNFSDFADVKQELSEMLTCVPTEDTKEYPEF